MVNPLAALRRYLGRRKREYIIREFNVLYYTGCHSVPVYQTTSWMGVPALKAPTDMWVYQELIHRIQPEVIVETGVNQGGSTLFLAHMLDLLGRGEVLSVDITLAGVHEEARKHPRITLFEGSSTDAEIVREIHRRVAGRKTMVILDSNHSRDHVLAEMRAYHPLVQPGSYLICEDTNLNGHPVFDDFGPGPFEAVQDFLAEHEGWEVDRHCERLLVTYNPSGYLRRLPQG